MKGSPHLGRLLRTSARALLRRLAGHRLDAPLDQVQLAMVIPVVGDLAGEATRLQIEILREFGHNPGIDAVPHITLKMGFHATDIAPFAAYVKQLASEVPAFEISIKNFAYFDEGILFMDVEPNVTLENLRQRILAELSERHGIKAEIIEGPQFRFHVTLAYGLASRDFNELRKSFASRQIQSKFSARHIDLFCHTGRQWVTCQHAKLLGGLDPH